MGMIRVSEQVEKRLKEVADGRSMNATIEKMLAYCSSPDGFCPTPQERANYEPYLLERIDKRFDELKALIEDTTIDRIDTRMSTHKKDDTWYNLTWAHPMQDVYFDFPSSDSIWLPGVYQDWANSDCMDQCKFYVEDDFVWADFFGDKKKQLRLTPELKNYLKAKEKYECSN